MGLMDVKNIKKADLPREKLERYGPGKLMDYELLAILLRTGTKDMNVLDLSRKILGKYKDKKILEVTIEELRKIHGLGLAKACEISACFELGKRVLKDKKASILLSPDEVWGRMEDIRGSKKEHFVVFYLDSRNQEICREVISVGTLNESLVHPREVFEGAIKNNAAAIILAHNHPSGNLESSQADIDITKRLIHAGKILDIRIIDHVIVANTSFKSMGIFD